MEDNKKQNNTIKQALLQPTQQPPKPKKSSNFRGASWFSLLGFLFLTFNSGMAVYRSGDDYWSIAFVIASYLDLLLLFLCLQLFESTPRGSSKRGQVKFAVWSLSTILTVMFSYRVAALMPLAVAIVAWAMALSTISAGFYLFFVYREDVAELEDQKPQKNSEGP